MARFLNAIPTESGRVAAWQRAAAAVAALRAACAPLSLLGLLIPSGGWLLTEGVAYGGLPRQRLDIYRPLHARAPLKTVVFFYGGSWRCGDRAGYRFVGEALTSRGWLAVIPDYRVFPEVRFPGFVEDAALALRWVADNIARLGGDPAQVYLAGHSAGGHIAQMLALDRRFLADVGLPPRAIRGTIALAAPAAFDPLRHGNVREIFAHMADPGAARPIAHARGDAPPMLLLHGAADRTVPRANSDALAARIRALGGRARLVAYPGLGHVGIALALAAPFRQGGNRAVLDDIARFVEAP